MSNDDAPAETVPAREPEPLEAALSRYGDKFGTLVPVGEWRGSQERLIKLIDAAIKAKKPLTWDEVEAENKPPA